MKLRLKTQLSNVALLVTGGMLGIGLIVSSQITHAGPITGGTVTKIGVYQGVISIVPGAGLSVMEVGNAGRDFASTGTIYLRPGSLVPNGASPTNVPSIYADTGEANFDLGTGQLCLGTTANCKSSWSVGVGGDPNWVELPAGTPNHLETADLLPSPNTKPGIRITPTSGRALDIYANYNGPAIQLNQNLQTGTGVADQADGKVTAAGPVEIRYSPDLYDSLFLRGWDELVIPWNNFNDDDDSGFGGVDFNADTFDGDTTLAFTKTTHGSLGQYHDLYWKRVYSGGTVGNYLCVHTPDNALCVGGTNPGQTCTIGVTVCPGGGVCTQMCSSVQQICPRDNLPENGEPPKCFNGATYRTAGVVNCSSCTSQEACIWGRAWLYTSEVNSCSPSNCNNHAIFDVKCSGTGPAACGAFTSTANSDRGECRSAVYGAGGVGPCFANGNLPGFGPYTCTCDSIMETDKPYTNGAVGAGADLCTEIFQ